MQFRGKRVLVSGASGFLGTALSRALLAEGAVVDGTYCTGSVPQGVTGHYWEMGAGEASAELIEAARPDWVFHLASPVVLKRDPALLEGLQRQIVAGGKALALACEAQRIPVVVAGTCEEYGDQQAPFHEDLPARPVSPYSTAKAELNAWILHRIQAESLRATIVRPFLTYGPGQRSARLIPTAIQAALKGEGFDATTGLQTREFNFVTDMALALMAAADPQVEGQILNLGGGEERSLREVVEEIYRLAGADSGRVNWGAIPHRAGEVNRFYGDHSCFQKQLKHRPQMGLTDGLRATIAWWRSR